MNWIHQYVRRPQGVWIRRAMFQIHMWLGVIIALYVFAIGLTGSILVFKSEAVESLVPRFTAAPQVDAPRASIEVVVANLRKAYPRERVAVVHMPSGHTPEYRAIALRRTPKPAKLIIVSDPATGAVVGDVNLTESWLGFVHNLHIVLLAGQPGFIANGVGAILLLLLCISGVVVWWPGISSWKRGFILDLKMGWKRINFDLHNTIGFYTLALVSFWAISTVYFVFPEPFVRALRVLSKVTIPPPRSEKVHVPAHPQAPKSQRASLDTILSRSREILPGAQAVAISAQPDAKTPVIVYMASNAGETESDELPSDLPRLYFDPVDGKHLATIRPYRNQTVGDWIIWSMVPLHFGTKWGMAFKVLWAVLGLSIPVLTVTGLLMYWNRFLGKKWKGLRLAVWKRPGALAGEPEERAAVEVDSR